MFLLIKEMNESNPEVKNDEETESDRAFTYTRKTKAGKEDRRCVLHKQQERIKTAIQLAREQDDDERVSAKYELELERKEKKRIEDQLKEERIQREKEKEELRQQLRDEAEQEYLGKLQRLRDEADIKEKNIYDVAFKDGLVRGKTNRIEHLRHTMACKF
jgi:lipopolysaccharide export LptBFGC system permease protein LptF